MTQTTDEFSEILEAEDLEARRAAVEQIKSLYEWRKTETAVKAQLAKLDPSASEYPKMGPLRRWLHDHEGEDLHDDETGLVAWLAPGGESDAYADPREIKKVSPRLYDHLELLGCFTVDARMVAEMVKQHKIELADLAEFRHKVTRTPSLRVNVQEKRKA